MDADAVAEVAQVAVSLPGLRGAGVLRKLFVQQSGGGIGTTLSYSTQSRADLGKPTSVHISPGHVFVRLDDGERCIGHVFHPLPRVTLASLFTSLSNQPTHICTLVVDRVTCCA